MTTQTTEAPATEAPTQISAEVLAALSKLSPDKLAILARLEADEQDSLDKLLKRAEKKIDARAEDAQKKVLEERAADINAARSEFYRDLWEILSIEVPSTGIVLKDTIRIAKSDDGKITVEISKPTVSIRGTTGSRGAKGTGAGKFVINATNVAGFQGYNLPDGTKNASAAKACSAVGIDQGSSSAAAFFTNWAAKSENREAANKVMIMIDGEPKPAGDFVASKIAKPATTNGNAPAPAAMPAAPAATAPASA